MKLMDIVEVGERTKLPASALRYYEEKGLIRSVGRRGLRRLFTPDVLQRLSLIKLGRNAGFSLEEIGGMFAPNGQVRISRPKLAAKADELQKTIRELSALRDSLRHAAECRADSHLECPTFQRLLRVAGNSRAKPIKRSRSRVV